MANAGPSRKRWHALLDANVLPAFPGWHVLGSKVIFVSPHVVSGIHVETSAFTKGSFCINYFVLPLFVPTAYWYLTYGNRLGTALRGQASWWTVDADNEGAVFSEVRRDLQVEAKPFFESNGDLEGFLRYVRGLSQARGRLLDREAFAYGLLLVGSETEAREVIDTALSSVVPSGPADDVRVQRLITLQRMLSGDADDIGAIGHILGGYARQNAKALGLQLPPSDRQWSPSTGE